MFLEYNDACMTLKSLIFTCKNGKKSTIIASMIVAQKSQCPMTLGHGCMLSRKLRMRALRIILVQRTNKSAASACEATYSASSPSPSYEPPGERTTRQLPCCLLPQRCGRLLPSCLYKRTEAVKIGGCFRGTLRGWTRFRESWWVLGSRDDCWDREELRSEA